MIFDLLGMAAKKVLVQHGNSSRVFTLEDVQGSEKEHLIQVTRSTFGIKGPFFLQIKDEDFDMYVDLEDDGNVGEKSVLRVVEEKKSEVWCLAN